MSSGARREPLACPACARRYELDERFCARCGMPLVYAGAPVVEEPASDAHGRARKVRPEFTRGDLVRVAGGRNQAEAELIQNILLEEGVPSVLRRTAGFDVPDFLAGGPRDVMVPASGFEAAHGTLFEAELIEASPPRAGDGSSTRQAIVVLAAILAGGSAAAAIAWLLIQAAG
jgi:hypothetical protein